MNNLFKIATIFLIMITGCAAPLDQTRRKKIVDQRKYESFDYFYREGKKELKKNNFERAIELFSEGISIDNTDPDIYLSRGIACFKLGEYDQSRSDLLRVLSFEPDNKKAKKWLGKVQFYRGNFDEAFSYFHELGRENLSNKDDLEWYNLIRDSAYTYHLDEAESAKMKGDYTKSEEELKLCRWIKPEESEPICRICDLYILRGEPWLSLRLIKDYTSANQSCIFYYKALTEFILADFDEAIKTINILKEKFERDDLFGDLSERMQQEENGEIVKHFNGISESTTLTRGEMAFLIAIRIVPRLILPSDESIVVTDIGESELRKYIYLVLNMGLMQIYPNHTFKPARFVRRQDFVVQIDYLLDKIGVDSQEYISAFPPVECEDLSSESNYYNSAQKLLRMGLIQPYEDNTFRGEENISGKEAIYCFEMLKGLIKD